MGIYNSLWGSWSHILFNRRDHWVFLDNLCGPSSHVLYHRRDHWVSMTVYRVHGLMCYIIEETITCFCFDSLCGSRYHELYYSRDQWGIDSLWGPFSHVWYRKDHWVFMTAYWVHGFICNIIVLRDYWVFLTVYGVHGLMRYIIEEPIMSYDSLCGSWVHLSHHRREHWVIDNICG